MSSSTKIFLGVAICLWLACGTAIASRTQLVFDYSTLPLVTPPYELFAAPASAMMALGGVLVCVGWMLFAGKQPVESSSIVVGTWILSSLPLLGLVLRIYGFSAPQPGWWEPVWFAIWTGVGVRLSCRSLSPQWNLPWWLGCSILILLIIACGGWWYWQSVRYYRDFQLGFNDFGHFTQRISNTASGRGFLLESPVLPPFWDHFNPGLALLVPLWKWFPSVEMIFMLQAACLSGSAGLVAWIARKQGHAAGAACCWGMAWLIFPVIGQMNLAYTYGWHPITLAIPCMLAAYLAYLSKRSWLAIPWLILAASFEEGVLVVIACYACAEGIRSYWEQDPFQRMTSVAWAIIASIAVISFACVYQFSGLAPFQTGRFARLGNNPLEIAVSPLMRPQEFWGLLLRPRNLAFACMLLGPFVVVGRSKRLGAWWSVVPPLLVLMVWEHMPAQSIAFQYTSCLIPVLFVDAIGKSSEPSVTSEEALARACGMLAVGWVLSIFVGQMPWSNDSLLDVRARTYGIQQRWNRTHTGEDAVRIEAWIRSLRTMGDEQEETAFPEWNRVRVLATGRIAAHCVGAADLETVGQFWQRYDALQQLDPELASPILRYDAILLDFKESFQQTPEETRRVFEEAQRHGWVIHDQAYDLIFLSRGR
ncbi:MAG: DUF2079 domain-containing protein [Pirellula sp.]|nr:DUF2079 domain-containing protein [Pirellula sp.]